MSALREKQSKFVRMIADLTIWAYDNGYELTYGEAFRSNEQAEINAMGFTGRRQLANVLIANSFGNLASAIQDNTGNGIKNSLHMLKLAIDFNVFKNGVLAGVAQIAPLGEKWESMGGTWGGRFSDSPHFSLEHNGVK